MSMELHTLRAVKITKNIFELRRVNTELQKFRQVVSILENRKSELSRHGYQGVKQAIAANVDQICIVIAPEPEYSEDLINQYLISAEHLQIKPIIVFNKTDKLSQQKIKKLKQQLSYYQDIGYPLLFVSCKDTESLKELSSLFNHKTSILSGQSGVGKSSIIQQLLPDISIQIGELSAISKLGQHTTTQSTLYNMQQGGHIIDSPGIRQFGLHGINKTMAAQGFIEIHQRSSTCKYNNCTHTIEPKCGVIEATENLKIHPARYQSYLKIIESLAK